MESNTTVKEGKLFNEMNVFRMSWLYISSPFQPAPLLVEFTEEIQIASSIQL